MTSFNNVLRQERYEFCRSRADNRHTLTNIPSFRLRMASALRAISKKERGALAAELRLGFLPRSKDGELALAQKKAKRATSATLDTGFGYRTKQSGRNVVIFSSVDVSRSRHD